mmetsp:Transcript_5316/g.15762  ORF Transcript_5316/g.15762 Transcript_5316/m.15762 type:complete len:257 (-) Transcript_5316:464-1234(-)
MRTVPCTSPLHPRAATRAIQTKTTPPPPTAAKMMPTGSPPQHGEPGAGATRATRWTRTWTQAATGAACVRPRRGTTSTPQASHTSARRSQRTRITLHAPVCHRPRTQRKKTPPLTLSSLACPQPPACQQPLRRALPLRRSLPCSRGSTPLVRGGSRSSSPTPSFSASTSASGRPLPPSSQRNWTPARATLRHPSAFSCTAARARANPRRRPAARAPCVVSTAGELTTPSSTLRPRARLPSPWRRTLPPSTAPLHPS